ncbi:MAG: protein-L-isoaspartate(D-aspartate) O-methyltransferase [Dehalococcoidales bacterium]|nr:MAG: protein-L-isoaspartate(D-aspartate) O-methyltransferase [Dehalococcoidales bacterium]
MDFEEARTHLIESLASEIKDKRVLAAMARIPREHFVPPESARHAYEDRPLPIGLDQTISQPFIVACMTEGLELTGKEKVLEIGTGSGYQTAILSELARLVVSTERLPQLLEIARESLGSLGYNNIELHLAEETLGWKARAPFDAIIATAAAPRIPDELVAQLKIGGRMIIPVGSRYVQELCKLTRHRNHNEVRNLGACRFVSLIGKGAWPEE